MITRKPVRALGRDREKRWQSSRGKEIESEGQRRRAARERTGRRKREKEKRISRASLRVIQSPGKICMPARAAGPGGH
jgi:hypothetical protein